MAGISVTLFDVHAAQRDFSDHVKQHRCKPGECPARVGLYRKWMDKAGTYGRGRYAA